jgi:hypothetical protein
MRENRTYGSEGGEGHALPDPYRRFCKSFVGFFSGQTLSFLAEALEGRDEAAPEYTLGQ